MILFKLTLEKKLSRSAKIKQNVLITASASLVTLSLVSTNFKNQLHRITAGCVIVFEMFRRNGDCTFYVAVKIGGDSKKMLGLGAISFDKAF
jgi:hypothetical protein